MRLYFTQLRRSLRRRASLAVGMTLFATAAGLAQAPASTPTSEAIARGRALLEKARTAGGGDAVKALKSLRLVGTSAGTTAPTPRRLEILAQTPFLYRQEEAPAPGRAGLHVTMGLQQEDFGWLVGGRVVTGAKTAEDMQRAAAAVARHAMVGVVAGISPMWLIETGRFTPSDAGPIPDGADKGAWRVTLDGPDGRAGTLVLDPQTWLPRKLIAPPQKGTLGDAATNDTVYTYSHYRAVKGVQVPFTIARAAGKNTTTWTITDAAVNPRLLLSQFGRSSAR